MITNEINNVFNGNYTNDSDDTIKIIQTLISADILLRDNHTLQVEVELKKDEISHELGCKNGKKIILNVEYVIHTSKEEIKNTILHQIAHLLVGVDNGHNEIWQEKAKELGVKF